MLTQPYDQAMSLSVGGQYERMGERLLDLLIELGLAEGHTIVDVGCGSGRLPAAITRREGLPHLEYLGTDVVRELIDYAKTKSRPNFRFQHHVKLSIPAGDGTADFVTFFSVFTHLLHEESFVYLREASRVLKSDGRIVVSFLEFGADAHWPIFESTVQQRIARNIPHLNVFTERNMYEVWASKLGLRVREYRSGPPIGQSVIVLGKA